jgi:hypothetical protein
VEMQVRVVPSLRAHKRIRIKFRQGRTGSR